MGTVSYTVIDGEVVSENRNGALLDYVPDPLGSTVAMLDNTQTITDTFTYWPYGEVVNRSGTTPTQFQYVGTLGYYKDNASTNVKTYVRNRYLDHAKCRWLTQDPIGFAGGEFNLYRYVQNNPISFVDPAGKLTGGKIFVGIFTFPFSIFCWAEWCSKSHPDDEEKCQLCVFSWCAKCNDSDKKQACLETGYTACVHEDSSSSSAVGRLHIIK